MIANGVNQMKLSKVTRIREVIKRERLMKEGKAQRTITSGNEATAGGSSFSINQREEAINE